MAALRWEAVIGLEVHAQIRAASKIFSRAPVHFGAYANRLVAPLDAGLPGALPVLSRRAVEACVAAGLAVGGTLQAVSSFDRKHYFYQDMPLGYQITQQRVPLVRGGAIAIAVAAAEEAEKAVRINHIRIEQDSGKSIHDQHPTLTLVDFNRAGAGLMEIVSEPDLRSGEEAAAYLQKLAQLLTHVGACSIDEMDASTFRCDVNVSVRRVGAPLLGTRCEVKNLNKTKSVRRAIDYEIARQVGLLEAGGAVLQETRAFNARSGRTYTLRSKEDALDYRYSPEPDLPPLVLDPALVDAVRQQLPELPDARFARLRREYGLAPAVARMLVLSSPQCSLFEGAAGALGAGVAGVPSFARIAEIVTGELAGHLERASVPFSQCAVTAEQIASHCAR
jgi:aspartyl-tRNA(Asn)/glutamyl-tRNA(Gln) amidotransferase subunit B